MADDYNPHSSSSQDWELDSNETSAWQQPQGQPQGPVQGEYAQQYPANPQAPAPAPAQKSNTGLYVAVGIAGVILAGLVGVGGAYFLSNSSDNSPQDSNPVVAGDSSSSTMPPAPGETYTETYTQTQTVEPEATSAPKTSPRGNFGQRAFGMNRNDIDAGGWLGSSAHCSGGYYARMLVETSSGKAVICENSNNRQQRHYIGDFSEISANPDAYTVESFTTNRAVAKNGDFTYTVTPNTVTVTKNGEEIFRDTVTDFGVLNAG